MAVGAKKIEQYLEYVRLNGGIKTALPISTTNSITTTSTITAGGVSSGTPATLASSATVAFTPSTVVTTHTPASSETINFSTPGTAGTEIFLEIVTSGTSSYTLTFGTNTKTTGTLATGTADAKTFMISFVSDGTNWVETARTTAM